jgi:hypothetical protein
LRHFYADDSQLYIVFNPRISLSRDDAVKKIEACAEDLRKWMTNNFLKLNEDKTELIIVTSKQMVFDSFSVTIGNNIIAPSPTPPRNLGVYFDGNFSLKYHVCKVSQQVNALCLKLEK